GGGHLAVVLHRPLLLRVMTGDHDHGLRAAVEKALQDLALPLDRAGPQCDQGRGAALEQLGLDALGPGGEDLVVQIRHEHADERASGGRAGAGPASETPRRFQHRPAGGFVHPRATVQHAGDRRLAHAGSSGDVDESRHHGSSPGLAATSPWPIRDLKVLAHSCTDLPRGSTVTATGLSPAPVECDHDSKEKTCRSVVRASSPWAGSPPPWPCSPHAAPTRARAPAPAPAPPTRAAPRTPAAPPPRPMRSS